MAIFKTQRITGLICKVAAATFVAGLALPFSAGAESLSDRVDAMYNSVDDLEEKVRSTLLSGGSSPVSFSGEARLRAQYHNLGYDAPGYMQADRSYFQSGWEGNENLFRLGMVVSPSRNTILWSKIGLQHTLAGNRNNNDLRTPDGVPYQYRHDKVRNSVTIHEDMSAGIAIRTLPASFWVRMGNTMWTEASPFTVWKAQPRTFAWEYLPFEVEQPIARYYEYNIAKGMKEGRAAWNKKPFNGINFESINLPLDLYLNFVYGTFERYDNFEREYIDFAGDLGYADGGSTWFPEKGHGIGDSYRHVIHARIAKEKLYGNMILGLNYVGIDYNERDVLFAAKLGDVNPAVFPLLHEFRGNDSVFVKEPKVFSIDLKGPINNQFSIHADFALSRVDTVWMIDTTDFASRGYAANANPYKERTENPGWYNKKAVNSSDFAPAAYLKLNYNGFLPTEVDLAYVGPGFYSPFSFAVPMDAFFAYGSNMVGAGKFIARGEGSPYVQNMTGVNLTFSPKLTGYGHLRVKYGQHLNVNEEGRDLLFFPYRLNGSDMFSFFHSSFNRWGNGLIDNSVKAPSSYKGRLGDESFVHTTSYNTVLNQRPIAGPGAGGLRSDYLSMFEGFVPYESALQASLNFRSRHVGSSLSDFAYFSPGTNFSNLSTITNHALFFYETDLVGYDPITYEPILDTVSEHSTNASWVPTSRKFTNNVELDAAYDIGKFIGYDKDLFVGGYIGISNVTRGQMSPIALPGKDSTSNTLLWSAYLRLEPAIALTKNFYLLGLFGYENWRSEHSWMMVTRGNAPSGSPAGTLGPVSGLRNPLSSNATPQGSVPGVGAADNPNNIVRVPINTVDMAYGLGFDWDMISRVGLHGRVKWISHTDKGLNDMYKKWEAEGAFDPNAVGNNDWSTWIVSLELKTWF